MLIAEVRKCFSCKFENAGECFRFPPLPIETTQRNSYGNEYPEIQYHHPSISRATDWCGEHKFDKKKFAAYVLTK
jgi:hypothetical protein